jgi:hypothetical protein
MEQLKLAVFIAQVLHCFHDTKKRICAEIIQLSNQNNLICVTPTVADDNALDKIASLQSMLLTEAILESQFLEFANRYPDKITNDAFNNTWQFYKQIKSWNLR